MKLGSVAVIGGGPGGLFAARLIKLSQPECRVDVYEEIDPARTFGFGVGLATRTQRNVRAADPQVLQDILAESWPHDMSMDVGGRRVVFPGDNLIAIQRSTLLDLLRGRAVEAGVVLHHDTRVSAAELDADLIVAADGVSSATRDSDPAAFGASVVVHDGLYMWCGTDFALPSAVFEARQSEFGTFVLHAYPYAPDRSTFLIETDEQTWRRAGFDVNGDDLGPNDNDEASIAFVQEVFRERLRGHRLMGNRTRWLRFRAVSCERWHRGNVVLLGDAAHTAHYSIGSGTKLAMEGAIALNRGLQECDTLEQALTRYEELHRPSAEHLQETANRSMHWWDSFHERLDLPTERLLVAYMTRAGKVSLDSLAARAPEMVDTALAQYADTDAAEVDDTDRVRWVLERPLDAGGRTFGTRTLEPVEARHFARLRVDVTDSWDARADDVIAKAAKAVDGGAAGVLLASEDTLGAAMTMCDVAERVKRATSAIVAVELAAERAPMAAEALVSGRIDLVVWGSPGAVT